MTSLKPAMSWLIEHLLREYPTLEGKTVENLPIREWLAKRIAWGIPKGFSYWWTNGDGLCGAIMIRPINQGMIEAIYQRYWETICDYDLGGDICWIDYAYGPGLWTKMLALCRSTSCTRTAWQHRDRLHLYTLDALPSRIRKPKFHPVLPNPNSCNAGAPLTV
jgi:hypothetical protein